MAVRRVVANLPARDPQALAAFYGDVLGLGVVMDLGFIVTVAEAGGGDAAAPQLSLGREGGAGTDLPAISVEVDDLDAVLARARALGAPIPHGPVTEDWGVRRFFLQDPEGNLVNVLTHQTE